ncbi:hypothetical protein CRYUN_Cryun09bG0038700 [Craigia yunnanensis]
MAYETVAAMQGQSLPKGPWHEEEDERLITFVKLLGSRRWDYVARVSGLKRSGKSCRLRWPNYLRPNIKHGHISAEEEKIIQQLHERWGSKDNGKLLLFQEDGSSAQTYNRESYKPCEDILETGNSSYDAVALSDYTLTNSPFQTRLSDWISEFPSDQSEIKSQEDSNCTDHSTVMQHGFPRRMIYGDVQAPSGTWNKMSLLKCEHEEAIRI